MRMNSMKNVLTFETRHVPAAKVQNENTSKNRARKSTQLRKILANRSTCSYVTFSRDRLVLYVKEKDEELIDIDQLQHECRLQHVLQLSRRADFLRISRDFSLIVAFN